ncbi:copper chaperone PCu(A)C [Aestuariispira insulae]|uniref:Copper(I)-binding protein n=1 Tax=Aestuariispira insulae TaxID=1461337 RepID=A0A3D9HGC5_9PROT|nr:copper chaperone PCu(A)C [Aestuariispira insulae]RED48046.1 hypothetical protein DFP90_10864 [Aestuariispira insulae]
MKKIQMIVAAVVTLMSVTAFAHDVKLGDLMIEEAWARASATKQAKAGGAYLTIHNKGDDDKLIRASSDVAKKVELHTHQMVGDGVMKMTEVAFVPVPSGGMAELKPGSYHVMFMGLKQPFVEGEMFDLTLTFEKAGETTVQVMVKSVAHGAEKTMNHNSHGS